MVTTLVCSLHIAHEAAGALGTRHSLRPLFSRDIVWQSSGASRRETAESYLELEPSLRGAQRRNNPFFLCAARWIASRSLSSGAHSRDPLARNDGLRIGCLKIESISVVPDKRANGSRERAPDDRLRERDPGPITTDACCRHRCGASFAQHGHSWLWVPAFAGTTLRHYAFARPVGSSQ